MIVMLAAMMLSGSAPAPAVFGRADLTGAEIRRGREVAVLCMTAKSQAACVQRVAEENRLDTDSGWAAFEAGLYATAYNRQRIETMRLLNRVDNRGELNASLDEESAIRRGYVRSREAIGMTNWQVVAELNLPQSQRRGVAEVLANH